MGNGSETSIADDLLRNGYDRWYRLEEEKAAIGEDLKELFAELKAHGFTPKALRESFRRVRNINDADQQEHDAIVDLYVASLTGARPAHAHVENIDEFDADGVEITRGETVDHNGTPYQSGLTAGTEQSETRQAGDEPPETANEVPAQDSGGNETSSNYDSKPLDKSNAARPASVDAQPNGMGSAGEAGESAVTGGESAATPIYGEPGIVTYEHTPPEPMVAHPYATCWPVNRVDVTDGVQQPIVKIGNLFLDGRARFLAARATHVGQNLTLEYPTVQYDGSDALLDSIRWNLDSRPNMTGKPLQIVAEKLCKLEPDRAEEIMALFGLAETQQAAQ